MPCYPRRYDRRHVRASRQAHVRCTRSSTRARANLADDIWDYIAGAAETETTARRNRLALDSLALRPRVLRDVSNVDTSSTLLGHPMRIPVLLAPLGSLEMITPDGGVPPRAPPSASA